MDKLKNEMVRCWHCGAAIHYMDAFCSCCGQRNGGWSTDYEGRCGNCHEEIESTDRYCRVCGTPRGQGAFSPYSNMMACIYGPEPIKRKHICNSCGYTWENIVMVDYDKYCPKCGQTVTVEEEQEDTIYLSDYLEDGWDEMDFASKASEKDEENAEELSESRGSQSDTKTTVNVIGYRYCENKVSKYEYYFEQIKLCTVDCTGGQMSQIRVSSLDLEWESKFDLDSTIFPGLTRYVMDVKTNQEVLRIVYKDAGRYEIIHENEKMLVCIDEGGYKFFMDEDEIASIKRTHDKYDWVPVELRCEAEVYWDVCLMRQEKLVFFMAVFAFPMLQFGF